MFVAGFGVGVSLGFASFVGVGVLVAGFGVGVFVAGFGVGVSLGFTSFVGVTDGVTLLLAESLLTSSSRFNIDSNSARVAFPCGSIFRSDFGAFGSPLPSVIFHVMAQQTASHA